jgi:hypothetical protein
MRKILLILFVLMTLQLSAQQYAASLIPEALKANANAIKRDEELRVIIKDKGHATVKHSYAITVMNEAGDKYASYQNSYDKFNSLSDITGTLYDANGKKIRSVKKKDIADISYEDGLSIASDARVKLYNFYYRLYPYTVEFSDEIEMNGLFFLPALHPADGFNMAVQQSKLVVVSPADYEFKTKLNNLKIEPVITTEQNKKIYTWQVNNVNATEFQRFQPNFPDVATSIYITPTDFELAGYSGDMRSWKSLGEFIVKLNAGRDALPEATKQKVHQLTDGVQDKTEKIKILYNYLQQNSRYILVTLGMGGWQPFDAAYVAEKKFGDCKALSNFMVSLLKEAGIPSNYALIRAGSDESNIWEDFPSPYFNHATVCVPNGKDSIWLECTSQTQSAGFMGSFTGGRKALLIKEDGGHLVDTRHYTADENLQKRTVTAELTAEGHLKADVFTRFSGLQQERLHSLIHFATEEQKKKYLNGAINLPTYEVVSSDYKERKGMIPEIDERLVINAQHYANISGKRIFITPNVFNRSPYKFSGDEQRVMPIELGPVYKDIDSVNIVIPEGYTLEAKPKDVELKSDFGKYSIRFNVNENKINVIRVDEMYHKTYPATSFSAFAEYMNKINKADNGQLVFVKKE